MISMLKNTKEYLVFYNEYDSRDSAEVRIHGPVAELVEIQVESKRRNRIGSALIEAILDYLREYRPEVTLLYAITRANNLIAQEFYENRDFRVVAPLREFYGDSGKTVDAIMYGFDLYKN